MNRDLEWIIKGVCRIKPNVTFDLTSTSPPVLQGKSENLKGESYNL